MKKKLVIIPAYNERGNIVKTVRDIIENAPSFDYVVINDCSKDDTRAICEKHGFHVVNLPVNLGIGGGVQTGYLYAMQEGYDIAVQFDGDGQHNGRYLEMMADKLEEEKLDMLIGSRFIENEGFQSSFMRRLGINIISFMIKLFTGKKIYDVTSGYRACNKELINFFADNYADDYPEPEAIITSVLSGFKVGEVPVVMVERQGGTSSIRSLKSAYYMIKVCLALVVDRIKVRKAGK